MFEQDTDATQIAGLVRVSTKSVYQWRRAWRSGGEAALASRGPGGSACKLDDEQLSRLRAALAAGPAVYGWDADQRWTLAWAAELIQRPFHVSYTAARGVVPATPQRVHPAGPRAPRRRAR
jgi:putative transposase